MDKKDGDLIDLVKNQANSEAFNEVCRRYENVFYKICQKYVHRLSMSGVNPQDIFDEKNTIIYHCINTFSVDKKAKLSTWIGNHARWICLNSINERRFILPSSDDDIKKHIEDSQVSTHYFNNPKNAKEDYNYILNILSQLKDERIKNIFNYRYLSGKKMIWSDIAQKMDISTQTAINLHNKGLRLLKEKVKSKNILDIV